MVSNPLNKQVGAGLSIKGVLLLGSMTLLTNFGSQYIQNKSATANKYKILNDSALSGTIKLVTAGVGASMIKNKYVKYGLVGVGLDGAQDLLVSAVRKARSYTSSENNAQMSGQSVA